MKETIIQLQEAMNDKIAAVSTGSKLQETIHKLNIVKETLTAMKAYIVNYTFKDNIEEIEFFKTHMPQVYSEFLYYKKLLELETILPVGRSEQNAFYKREVWRANSFLDRKRTWVTYYRTEGKHLDEYYFLRNSTFNDPAASGQMLTSDTRFCTVGSIIFSRLICSEKLIKELESRLSSLDGKDTAFASPPARYGLRWTASKTDAIEFLYWLHSSEAINDGRADVKQIADWLQETLDIDLGNYYRVIQGIRIRKNRTQFTDFATQKFIRRMDDQDENPRY